MSGLLITLEGGEGCGKSTQASDLAERLRSQGHRVTLTREPGGTPLGERLRQVLLDPQGRSPSLDPLAEYLLFAAARAEVTAEVIKPALERSDIVVCDRYGDSSLAYQGYGRGVNLDHIRAVNEAATAGLRPDLTVLLDLPPEVGLARQRGGASDRFQREQLDFHRRLREGYLALAREEPDRWLVLDGTLPASEITERILRRARELLP